MFIKITVELPDKSFCDKSVCRFRKDDWCLLFDVEVESDSGEPCDECKHERVTWRLSNDKQH